MKVLNVTYTVKKGMREKYIQALLENRIAERCLQEEGVLQYAFYLPVDQNDTESVFLKERYTGDEAFAFHKTQPHFLKLQEIKAEYVESTDVQIFDI